jgi:hypothetical protein
MDAYNWKIKVKLINEWREKLDCACAFNLTTKVGIKKTKRRLVLEID